MSKFLPLLLLPLIAFPAAGFFFDKPLAHPDIPANPQAIVALSPAITDALVNLGQSGHIAGVSRTSSENDPHADFPSVGNFREVNAEAILSVKPDLVVLPADLSHFRPLLENLGLPVMIFDARSLASLKRDMARLGAICNAEDEVARFLAKFPTSAKQPAPSDKNPSLAFILLTADDCGKLPPEMNIIGADGFYNDIIALAGGKNAYTGKIPYPAVTLESLHGMNPRVIFISAPGCLTAEKIIRLWKNAFPGAEIFASTDPAVTLPGPGISKTLTGLSEAIQKANLTCR